MFHVGDLHEVYDQYSDSAQPIAMNIPRIHIFVILAGKLLLTVLILDHWLAACSVPIII